MINHEYDAARNVAAKELKELLGEQKRIEQRIGQLRETITALDALSGRKLMPVSSGLTDAIRSLFSSLPENRSLSAGAIKGRLMNMGFDEGHYSNFMSAIHVVLRRLTANKEIKRVDEATGLAFVPVKRETEADYLAGV